MSSPPSSGVDDWAVSGPGLLGSMAQYKYAIALATLLFAVVGYLVSSTQPPVYYATATIFLSDASWSQSGSVPDPTRRIEQEANKVASRAVFARASELLSGGADPYALAGQVTSDPIPAVGLIQVTASSDDPDKAAAMANAVTDAYEQVSREAIADKLESVNGILDQQGAELGQEINRLETHVEQDPSDTAAEARLETLQAQLFELRSRISEMSADAALYGSGIDEVEQAIPPGAPSSPKPLRDAQIAGLFGCVVASGLAYWRAIALSKRRMDRSAVLGAPLLAQIPEFKDAGGGVVAANPLFDVEAAEAYQFLLTSFEYALEQTETRSVLVTSPRPGDGKSLTALHLARALAIQGRDVTLVDSDIRARGITSLLRAEHLPGLVALADGESLQVVTRRYRISQSVQLSVVPSGRLAGSPTGLLTTAEYRQAIAAIIASNDLTIIDSAPLLTVADASSIAPQVDGVLLVIDPRTSEDDLRKVSERMRLMATPLIGYVLNRASDDMPSTYADSTIDDSGPSRHSGRFRARPIDRRIGVEVDSETKSTGHALGSPRPAGGQRR